jgi:hypothetical protein
VLALGGFHTVHEIGDDDVKLGVGRGVELAVLHDVADLRVTPLPKASYWATVALPEWAAGSVCETEAWMVDMAWRSASSVPHFLPALSSSLWGRTGRGRGRRRLPAQTSGDDRATASSKTRGDFMKGLR